MKGHSKPSVLLIEDDRALAAAIARELRAGGLRVETADCVEDGVARVRLFRHDLVVCDLRLGDRTALEVLDAIEPLDYRPPVLLMSAWPPTDVAELVRRHAIVVGYLHKPFEMAALRGLVDRTLHRGLDGSPDVQRTV